MTSWYNIIFDMHCCWCIRNYFMICSGVTLRFEHSPSRASEIEHLEIFSCPQENQLAQ